MGYGIAEEAEPATLDGLDNFDEDEAAPGDSVAAPDLMDFGQAAADPDGLIDVGGPPAGEPGAAGAPVGDYPPAPQFPELALPPPPPALTGDPQKDVMANAEYQRTLNVHHGELTKRQTALAEHAAAVGAMKGKKEAEVATVEAAAKKAEVARAVKERQARQAAVTAAVAARVEAARDVEGFKWDRPHTGKEIVSLIFGAAAAGFSNAAAANLGQVGHAENEAAKGIDARMEREYKAKVGKLKGAGDTLLMARYDAKTSEDAHRAAMNDLNAEMAAKYKAIAKEAESQLLQAGVPKAQAAGNVLVAAANEKAAAHEGDILNREEGHENSRRASAATLALARANLGERRREHTDTLEERKREFDLRKQEAADKKKSGAGGDGVEAAKNSVNFNLYREHADWIANNSAKLSQDDRKQIYAIVKSGGLGQLLEAGGALVGLDKEKGLSPLAKEYLGHMREAADGYGRVKSGGAINKDEEARFMDQFVVKPSDSAADIKARGANIQQNIRVMSPLNRDGGGAERPAPTRAAGGGLSPQQAATLVDRLRTHPDDPRTPQIKAKLRASGYKVP